MSEPFKENDDVAGPEFRGSSTKTDIAQIADRTRKILREEIGSCHTLDHALSELGSKAAAGFPANMAGLDETQINQVKRWCESSIGSTFSSEAELLSMLMAISGPNHTSKEFVSILARLHQRNDDPNAAAKAFQDLLKHKPDSQEAAYQLASYLHNAGRSDEGIETLWPQVISAPSSKNLHLFGLMLKAVRAYDDAISFFKSALELRQDDQDTRHQLLELYIFCDMHREATELIRSSETEKKSIQDTLLEALLYRSMGELERSIDLTTKAIHDYPNKIDPIWIQIFNFSISSAEHAEALFQTTEKFWAINNSQSFSQFKIEQSHSAASKKIQIGFLSADIGEHVASCFLAPILRGFDTSRFAITLLSTRRRYDARSMLLSQSAENFLSLEGLSLAQATNTIARLGLDVIVETSGFTSSSGIQFIARRCAPIQCHYIGYHATTGLETIDYFIGDPILTPPEFTAQFTEQIATLPSPWISYDSQIPFPDARAKIEVEQPVFGSFSQAAKIGSETLAFWTAAMAACEDAILIIKGKGSGSPVVQQRLMACFETAKIDPSRIIFANAVPSQQEHLDYYNKIDIALDTTPWSGATTAFEALGMGVPLIGIRGDTTSGRMSSSVLSAAGMQDHIADSVEEFAEIAQRLAAQFRAIRAGKAAMQQRIRSSILFDDTRIRHDFFALIDQLVATHKQISRAS